MMNFFRNKLYVGLIIVTVIIIAAMLLSKKMGWLNNKSLKEITTIKAERVSITEKVSASGKIFPVTEVKISPQVSGEIMDILFEEGDTVKKGNLILQIDPNIYRSVLSQSEASLNQAKANLANTKARLFQIQAQYENAQITFERNQKLFEKKAISAAEHDNAIASFKNAEGEFEAAKQTVESAEFSIKSAEAALRQAKDNLGFTSVYAPMDGIISALLVKKGERVVGTSQMAGTEMLRIADLDQMEVHVDVSENDILRVSLNDSVEIEIDAFIDKKFLGIVTYIANSSNSTNQQVISLNSDQVTNFTVKIRILKSSYADILKSSNSAFPFKPGMSASVEIITKRAFNVVAVPIQCVTIRDDEKSKEKKEVVFLHENGKAKMSEVKIGIQDERFIEILEGVDEGNEVISGPYRVVSKILTDGNEVKVLTEEELLKKEKANN